METPQTIDVVAPSDLHEGYQFQVDAGGGRLLTVQVPPGGVTSGERFSAIVLPPAPAPPTLGGGGAVPNNKPTSDDIPRGEWRDGLCDCFNQLNANCLMGCCCSPCAVGQVMTRMNLDWKADSFGNAPKPGLSTFKIVLIITASLHVLAHVFAVAGLAFMESIFLLLLLVYAVLITCRTRQLIRTTYQIPATTCGEDAEDCCCAFWCSPCTACQMSRHLVDFNKYPAQCCTDTGLGPEAPPLAEFEDGAAPPQTTTTPQSQQYTTQQQQQAPPQQQQTTMPPPSSTSPVHDEYSRDNEKTYVVDL